MYYILISNENHVKWSFQMSNIHYTLINNGQTYIMHNQLYIGTVSNNKMKVNKCPHFVRYYKIIILIRRNPKKVWWKKYDRVLRKHRLLLGMQRMAPALYCVVHNSINKMKVNKCPHFVRYCVRGLIKSTNQCVDLVCLIWSLMWISRLWKHHVTYSCFPYCDIYHVFVVLCTT
jgi:ribosomal protein L33